MKAAEISNIRHFDDYGPRFIVHEDDQVVVLMTLFPTCNDATPPQQGHHRRFHVRWYIPREILLDAKKKADRVVVMTNGLDEFDTFSLYDDLGTRLASRGIVAALVPIPDHLNRHTRYRKTPATREQIVTKPSEILMAEPLKLYKRYNQFCDELKEFVDHVKHVGCSSDPSACDIFMTLFGEYTRVSFLGYSLGAAAMLCAFLEQQERLNACFLLNGAIDLGDIIPHRMFPTEVWKQFVQGLTKQYRDEPDRARLRNKLFEQVFLAQYIDEVPALLQKHSRRVLFIFGGRDAMTSYQNIAKISPKFWGLGMMVLPGINHFLAIDEEWKQWSDIVVDWFVAQERSALRYLITEKAVLGLSGNKKSNASPISSDGAEHANILAKARLLGLNIEELEKHDLAKTELVELTKSTPFQELRLGEMLFSARLISFDQWNDACLRQKAMPQKRFGEILVEMGAVRMQHVEALVAAQKKPRQL